MSLRMGRRGARTGFKPRSKYNATKVTIDGVTFASKAEGRRYAELKLLEKAGEITHLILQPKYAISARPLLLNPVIVAHYIGDFQYYRNDGELVVEDVKGVKTPVYRLKKKFVEAQYGIRIREVA